MIVCARQSLSLHLKYQVFQVLCVWSKYVYWTNTEAWNISDKCQVLFIMLMTVAVTIVSLDYRICNEICQCEFVLLFCLLLFLSWCFWFVCILLCFVLWFLLGFPSLPVAHFHCNWWNPPVWIEPRQSMYHRNPRVTRITHVTFLKMRFSLMCIFVVSKCILYATEILY